MYTIGMVLAINKIIENIGWALGFSKRVPTLPGIPADQKTKVVQMSYIKSIAFADKRIKMLNKFSEAAPSFEEKRAYAQSVTRWKLFRADLIEKLNRIEA